MKESKAMAEIHKIREELSTLSKAERDLLREKVQKKYRARFIN